MIDRIPACGTRLRSKDVSIEVLEASSQAVLAVRLRHEAVSPSRGQPGARAAAD
jgi:hypothetical protein